MPNDHHRRSPLIVEILLALLTVIASFAGWNVMHGIQRIEDKSDIQAVRINDHYVKAAAVHADLVRRVLTLENGKER